MGKRSEAGNAVVAVLLLVAAGIVSLIWGLSKDIGADFGTVARAAGATTVICAIAGTLLWNTEFDRIAIIGAALSVVWLLWWPVMDSIAIGGRDPAVQQGFLPFDDLTLANYPLLWTLKVGVELALLGGTGWRIYRLFRW